MDKIIRTFHNILLNAINDSESADDKELYTLLRIDIITKADAVHVPDFIYSCDDLTEFKKFINTLYLVKSQQASYIDNIFIDLYKQYASKSNNKVSLNKTFSDTSNIITENISANTNKKSLSDKILKILIGLISSVATIATIYSVYLQVKSTNPHVTIIKVASNHLTTPTQIAGLKANYYYRDSAVSDLWKLDVIVKNTGNETIVSTGPHKNIISNEGIVINTVSGYKILDVDDMGGSLPAIVKETSQNSVMLKFDQWRNLEYKKIGIYLERIKPSKTPPPILLNERQIIDGKVEYTSYDSNISNHKKTIIDYIPVFISTPLKLSIIFIYGSISLALPFGAIIEIRKKSTKGEKIGVLIAFLIGFIMSAGPLLWIIDKFW